MTPKLSNRPLATSAERTLPLLVWLTLLFLLIWLSPRPSWLQNENLMPLWLHITMETFAVVVAGLIFGIAWNSKSPERPAAILILGCGFLSIGLLDYAHLLSFRGMPDFITPADAEKGVNFWLSARLTAAVILLVVALRKDQPFRFAGFPRFLLGGMLGFTALIYILGLFYADFWPRTFIAGQGLTRFKISMEYVISGSLLIPAYVFYRKAAREPDNVYARHLFTATSITILSELCFTVYSNVTDVFNLLGHLYKVLAYIYIYRAVFVTSVEEPFNKLSVARAASQHSEKMLQSIINHVPARVFWKDLAGRYLGANNLFLQDAGVKAFQQIEGKDDRSVFPEYASLYMDDDQRVIASGQPKMNYEEPISVADGQVGWLLTSKTPLYDMDGTHVIGILGTYSDITELKKSRDIINYQANYDELTSLPNRRQFRRLLEQAIHNASEHNYPVAVLQIDIDNFKEVNDTIGHQAGDLLLQEAGKRLSLCLQQPAQIARFGGDEFVILLSQVNSKAEIEKTAQAILQVLNEKFVLDNDIAYVSASIGISLFPYDTSEPAHLLKNADQALYQAKYSGKNQFAYFTPALEQNAMSRMLIGNDLRLALTGEQLDLYYQPIVDLRSGELHKAEALIRWQHPIKGMISPAEFIPIAENTGSILEIGDWVFRQAVQQALHWRKQFHRDIQISLNISPLQLQADKTTSTRFIEFLQQQGLPEHSIVAEITEGLLTNASASPQLMQFRDAGIQVAIDDFGTGFSSLSYLKRFAIDYIKIDQSFTRNLTPGSDDHALCEAIIVMAHKLGIKVIAEGIETEEQKKLLAMIECDYGQGYLFSAPIPADQFEQAWI